MGGTGVRSTKYTPKIAAFSATVTDVSVDLFSPVSVGVTGTGAVVAVDALVRALVVSGDGAAGAHSRPAGRGGVPYAQVICGVQDSVVVSYVSGGLVETLPLQGGANRTEPRPQLGVLFEGATYADTFISDMTANRECSLFYFLDGVHKTILVANETSYGWELHRLADERRLLQTLTTPTGVELFEGELFVADWGAGSILSLHIEHGALVDTTVVAGVGAQRPILDGGGSASATAAQLAGPTQLAGYMVGTGLLFTDRNPSLHAAAVRLLRTSGPQRGRVVTLAGGNLRGHVNGGSQRALFGGVWAVAYNPRAGGVIVVSEPTAGLLRRIGDTEIEWAACASGMAASPGGHAEQEPVVSCVSCAAGWWCPGDNAAHNCTGGRTSPAGSNTSAACDCPPGMSVGGDGRCATCPAGHYCLPGMSPARCAPTFVSPAGSSSPGACVCPLRYYADPGTGLCTLCPPGSYCVAGVRHACSTTGIGADSVPGAWDASNCSCKNGYKPVQGEGDGECEACDGAEVCWYTLILDMEVIIMLDCGYNLHDVLDMGGVKQVVLDTGILPPWVDASDITVDIALHQACTRGSGGARRMMQAGAPLAQPDMAAWRLMTRIFMKGVNKEDVGELQNLWTDERIAGASGGLIPKGSVSAQSAVFSAAASHALGQADCALGNGGHIIDSICVCGHGHVGVPPRCTPCGVGLFKDTLAYGVCTACTPHAHTPGVGARSRAECTCDVGYTRVLLDGDKDTFACEPRAARHFLAWSMVVGGILGGVLLCIMCSACIARYAQKGPRAPRTATAPRAEPSEVLRNVRLRRNASASAPQDVV